MKQQSGYILLLTLMIISISVFLVTYISNKGLVYIPFSKSVINREKSKVLAWGALEIATSQLQSVGLKEKDDTKDAPAQESWEKKFIKTFFPILNRWQTFTLKEEVEGIDATIYICLSSEEGKINLNNIYDFKEKKFKNGDKKFLQDIFSRIEKITGAQNLLAAFEKFLKERQYKMQDITELVTIKEFGYFKNRVFYQPPLPSDNKENKQKKGEQVRQLYLTDIFTIWPKTTTIEAWLLSPSLQLLFGFKEESNLENRKDMIEQRLEQFKIKADWKTDWNTTLNTMYGVPWQAVPEVLQTKLSSTFNPTIFSITIATIVDNVTQRLLAIFERVPTSQDDRYQFHAKLKKVYWL